MTGRQASAPAPAPAATFCLLIGLVLSYFLMDGETPSTLARSAAIGIGVALTLATLIDYRRNLRNLVRADIMALAALYFLTLFEFLTAQPSFDKLTDPDETRRALTLCYIAFAGLAIGRHWALPVPARFSRAFKHEFPPRLLLSLLGISMLGGYVHQLAAVDFNVIDWLEYSMAPRFTQPWGRGRLGDWKALLGEFGMIVYLIPPICGIIFARRKDYRRQGLIFAGICLAITLFSGFVGGTRNVLATYLATFSVAYAFGLPPQRKRELIAVVCASAVALVFATVFMLEFRNIGFRNYLNGYRTGPPTGSAESIFVDYNLYVMAKLTNVFPGQHPYLGLEIPYLAVVRPIPRAMWPGKPEGMSLSIEDALGAEGLTLASSFIGEAYISGGGPAVFITALIFGGIFAWWNRFGSPDNSPFGHLVFSSGFFASVISMRSMLVFTTAILPTIAALVLGAWLIRRQPVRRLLLYSDEDPLSKPPPSPHDA